MPLKKRKSPNKKKLQTGGILVRNRVKPGQTTGKRTYATKTKTKPQAKRTSATKTKPQAKSKSAKKRKSAKRTSAKKTQAKKSKIQMLIKTGLVKKISEGTYELNAEKFHSHVSDLVDRYFKSLNRGKAASAPARMKKTQRGGSGSSSSSSSRAIVSAGPGGASRTGARRQTSDERRAERIKNLNIKRSERGSVGVATQTQTAADQEKVRAAFGNVLSGSIPEMGSSTPYESALVAGTCLALQKFAPGVSVLVASVLTKVYGYIMTSSYANVTSLIWFAKNKELVVGDTVDQYINEVGDKIMTKINDTRWDANWKLESFKILVTRNLTQHLAKVRQLGRTVASRARGVAGVLSGQAVPADTSGMQLEIHDPLNTLKHDELAKFRTAIRAQLTPATLKANVDEIIRMLLNSVEPTAMTTYRPPPRSSQKKSFAEKHFGPKLKKFLDTGIKGLYTQARKLKFRRSRGRGRGRGRGRPRGRGWGSAPY